MRKSRLSGFTLVEVMTSLVIMSIMIVISSSVIITSFNIFGRNSLMRAAQNDGNNIYNYIYDHISYSSALIIEESADNTYEGIINRAASRWQEYADFIDTENTDTYKKIKPYYEKIEIKKDSMKLRRKTVDGDVYIYGSESNKNTLHGCDCTVSFEKYNEGDSSVSFSVTLERDSEIFYSRSGNIPILNEDLKNKISIADNADNDGGTLYIIYTYLE